MFDYIGLSTNGWPAVLRSFAESLTSVDKEKETQLSVRIMKVLGYGVANRTYAFKQLPEYSFTHSMRAVYLISQGYQFKTKMSSIKIYKYLATQYETIPALTAQ